MVQTNYTYSIANDTLNGEVNLQLLAIEIQNSTMTQPGKDDFEFINTDDDDMDIFFANALVVGDKTILDGVVGAHTGEDTVDKPQRVTALSEQTTTGSWTEALTMTADALQAGDWLIGVKCELALENGADFSSGAPDRAVQARVQLDGQTVVDWAWAFDSYNVANVNDILSFNEGDKPKIDLDFRLLGSGDTSKIRRAIIFMSKIMNTEEEEL